MFTHMAKKSETDVERRERRIDEALEDTFPASDTPSYVGGGARSNDYDKADQAVVRDERRQDQPANKKRAQGGSHR